MKQSHRLLFCHCAYSDIAPGDVKRRVHQAMVESGAPFDETADLCGLAARQDPLLKEIARGGPVKIAACHPRAVKWLFHAAGAPLPEQGAEILNMRTESAEAIVERILGTPAAEGGETHRPAPGRPPTPGDQADWIPWFPVIDYDRCENCRQCLNFCLFGVFCLAGDEKVRVENPQNCKTNCPACARICPQVAIIFPKYKASPINGDKIDRLAPQGEPTRIDFSALTRGNVYEALRRRSRVAEARAADKPDEEPAPGENTARERAAEVLKELGIPPEVLQSVSETMESQLAARAGPTSEDETPGTPAPTPPDQETKRNGPDA